MSVRTTFYQLPLGAIFYFLKDTGNPHGHGDHARFVRIGDETYAEYLGDAVQRGASPRTFAFPLGVCMDVAMDEPGLQEQPDTVSVGKFRALVEHCKRADKRLAELQSKLSTVRLYEQKEVWYW